MDRIQLLGLAGDELERFVVEDLKQSRFRAGQIAGWLARGADIGEMIVTPREIDAIVQDAAGIIASGINRALQPALSDAEIAAMMD